MFYRYNSKEEMKAHNPCGFEHILKHAVRTTHVAATRGKHCVGGFGGVFRYADGTQDAGEPGVLARAEFGGNVFVWCEEVKP